MKSAEELKIISAKQIAELLSGLSSVGARATQLETQVQFLTPTIIAEIQSVIDDVKILMNRNWISGGNLTVSDTVPTAPQENDIWFDTKLARR